MTKQLIGDDDLITVNVVPRVETYYLVTEEIISSVKEKTNFCDIFMFLGNFSIGFLSSVLIALTTSTNLPEKDVEKLRLYLVASAVASVITVPLTTSYYFKRRRVIDKIKKSKALLE